MKEKKREIKLKTVEITILTLLAYGLNDTELSQEIGKTCYQTRTLIYRLEGKTGTVNRPHLIYWACKNGVLKTNELSDTSE